MSVEYFELDDNSYWLAKWLKKPSSKEILKARNIIVKRSLTVTLGINKKLVVEIINDYIRRKNNDDMFGTHAFDYDVISCKFQLPKAMVMLILRKKGIV